jgi:hypothetical protein
MPCNKEARFGLEFLEKRCLWCELWADLALEALQSNTHKTLHWIGRYRKERVILTNFSVNKLMHPLLVLEVHFTKDLYNSFGTGFLKYLIMLYALINYKRENYASNGHHSLRKRSKWQARSRGTHKGHMHSHAFRVD